MARDMRRCGFTIIEIMVVIVLIGVLLGAFVFRTGGFSDHARIETARGDLLALQKAIQTYYLNFRAHGSYAFPAGNDWQTADLLNESPRVLGQILYDPFREGNTQYTYYVSSNGKYYVAFSYGPNKNADITGISDSGVLTGSAGDDIYMTNGS